MLTILKILGNIRKIIVEHLKYSYKISQIEEVPKHKGPLLEMKL